MQKNDTKKKMSATKRGSSRATIEDIKATIREDIPKMKPRVARALREVLLRDDHDRIRDLWRRWAKYDFDWVEEILRPIEERARQFADSKEFFELFRRATRAGVGHYRQHVYSLGALYDALGNLAHHAHEAKDIDDPGPRDNYPTRFLFQQDAQDAENGCKGRLIPPEIVAGYTPTLRLIIKSLEDFREQNALEMAQTERVIKRQQQRAAKRKAAKGKGASRAKE
jgi:hypothetical protein